MKSKKKTGASVILFLISLYLLLPLFFTLIYSMSSEWITVLPKGFTLNAYTSILGDVGFWQSIGRTLLISVLPIVVCTLIILFALYAVLLYCPRLERLMQILCTIPYAIQGIILPICVLSLYTDAPGILSNRIFLLTATYCIVVLPYLYQGIRNSMEGVNVRGLIEAAEMLGAGRFYAFIHVIIPNIAGGVTVSAMLAMAIVFGDFVVINTIAGSYYQTAQMYLYEIMKKSGQTTCAIIMILFLVTLLISASVFGRQKKEKN